MRKAILITTLALTWIFLNSFWSMANANDKNTAIVGHVIQSKVYGESVDTSVLEAEIAKIAHTFAQDMVVILQKNLPNILDSISAQLRAQADLKYKCSIQSEYIKDKKCK